jgi:hypothetical protein
LCARVCRRCFLLGDDPFTHAMLGTQLFVVSPAIGGDVWRVGICSNTNVS